MIHYIIARRDLKRTVRGSTLGVIAAQVTHAAGESFAAWAFRRPNPLALLDPTIACVLGVPNEQALKRLEKKLKAAKVPHIAVREPDAPWNGQLMTIGLWPMDMTDAHRRLLRRYTLL
jgi:hypothetical protein